ncbi:NAD-P-binding protein [Lenzites betulinus]|nr:NAD-P-binding protein [Lenzites betulinus]
MSSTPTTWVITGASRGIGLEFVRQTVASPDNIVIAAARNPDSANGLNALKDSAHTKGTLHIVKLDVDDFDGVRAAAKEIGAILGDKGLDYLVNNAGKVDAQDTGFTVDPEVLLSTVRTNAAGPALVSQVLLPYIEQGKRKTLAYISSTAGSIRSVERVGSRIATYAISKAALNMLAEKQRLERPDLIILTFCPGWVKTGMGGDKAPLEPSESVGALLKLITTAKPEDTGKYLRYNGEVIPW